MSNIHNPCYPCQENQTEPSYTSVIKNEEEKPNPDCVVQFYRSEQEISGNYGYKDNCDQEKGHKLGPPSKYYDATFGFDRFNSKVCAEYDISKYEKLNHLIPQKTIVKDIRLYLCPFLSILPSKKISIYARAEEFHNKSTKGTEIEVTFKSKSASEIIISQNKQKLTIGDDNSICKIEVECKGEINDTCIEAYQKTKNDKGKDEQVLIGKINIVGNKIRYSTIIRPVIVRFYKMTNNEKEYLNAATNAEQNVIDTYKKLIPYLQDYSFNQAYIKCEEDSTFPQTPTDISNSEDHYLDIDINGIDDKHRKLIVEDKIKENTYYLIGSKTDFLEWIEMLYTGKDAAGIKNKAIADEQIKECLTKLITELKKGFKFDITRHKTGEDCINARLLTKAFHRQSSFLGFFKKRPVIEAHRKYREARLKYLKTIRAKGISLGGGTSLMDETYKNGYVHVYFFPDIARSSSEKNDMSLKEEDIRKGNYVPGFANTGSGTAYIMNVCIDPGTSSDVNTQEAYKLNKAYIAHEIGHTLGLKHPFEKSDTQKYQTAEKKEYDSKVEQKKQLEYLQQNYERYKNGGIDENGNEIKSNVPTNSSTDNAVIQLYNMIKVYANLMDRLSQYCIIDQTTQEMPSGTIFTERLKNFEHFMKDKNADESKVWEPMDTPNYFDPKTKSSNITWSPNLKTTDGVGRDWNREFTEFVNNQHKEPLFNAFELILYMEYTKAPLQRSNIQTKAQHTSSTIKPEADIKNEICKLELRISELKKKQHLLFKTVHLEDMTKQSETEENFMDYIFDGQKKNDNFIHKSFRHFQWQKMWDDSKDKFLTKK